MGGVASRLQGDRVRRTVAEVRALLEQREREFGRRGIDSIATYRALRADGAIPGDGFGDVFLVVDGWLTLRQDYEELEQAVTALAARGLGYGIHLVAATNKWSEFRPAVRDLFGTRLELRLGDPYESAIGRAAARNVPAGAPGRGLTQDGLHFLAAMPRIDGRPTAAGLPEAVRALVGQVAAAWDGDGAPPVRMLPDVLPAAALPGRARPGRGCRSASTRASWPPCSWTSRPTRISWSWATPSAASRTCCGWPSRASPPATPPSRPRSSSSITGARCWTRPRCRTRSATPHPRWRRPRCWTRCAGC